MVGTGPSLLDESHLPSLRAEVTFGCIYLHRWVHCPFLPTYYGTSEPYHASIIGTITGEMLDAWDDRYEGVKKFVMNPEPVTYSDWYWVEKEGGDRVAMIGNGFVGLEEVDKQTGERSLPPLRTGRTSPLSLTQIAAWMGYRDFYYLGVDFSHHGYCYDTTADPGVTIHERTVKGAQRSFKVAKEAIEAAGGSMTSCVPESPINQVLDYRPLKEVLRG
jgi:hypothetical protein